jgi:AraC-like DNA-binding protein
VGEGVSGLGISVHRYITEKRMMHAFSKIKDGALPTKIYTECGYNDYATFYKAYVKIFGKAPSLSDFD